MECLNFIKVKLMKTRSGVFISGKTRTGSLALTQSEASFPQNSCRNAVSAYICNIYSDLGHPWTLIQ